MEAPPGFEPGMEVLQDHPRSFSRDRYDGESGLKSYRLIVIRESALGAHRVWRWSKLARIGSPPEPFGWLAAEAQQAPYGSVRSLSGKSIP